MAPMPRGLNTKRGLESGIAEQVLQELGKHGGGSLEDCVHHKHHERPVFVSRLISHLGDKD
jgi:hypothetical protein